MNQRYKRIDYEYDLLSGKVNNISYNHGYADQFFQRYAYDADNRLSKVETSHDGFIWKRDAEYTYYQHGPLARASIGDQRVQGIDYAYTIQGWLKAINGDLNDSLADMGRDGSRSTITPRDAYATTLDYFVGDYKPIGYTPLSKLANSNKSIYNGNIARQSNDVAPFGGLTTVYTYDQMNRIRKAKYAATKLDTVLMFNNWYASAYKYDMDGNLRELMRKEGTGITMDSMQYEYANPGRNNKLSNIFDHATFSKAGVEDIKFLSSIGYPTIVYDDDGNVRADIFNSNLEQASWNIYGKATMLYAGHGHSGGPHLNKLFYGYDALGHRTYKRNEYGDTGINLYKSTFYVREASGNILAEYNARIEYDQGRYIKVFPRIRATYTGATLMRDWLGALGTMGYLTDHAFADYIIARVGSSTTLATGYFLANNPSLVTPFLGGGFGTLHSMCNYSNATAEYPIADALQMSFDQNGAATPLLDISNALFGVPDSNLRRAAVLQLAQQVPDLPTQLAQQNQITLSSAADSATLLTLMDNLALSNPAYYGGELYNFYQQDPTILYNWLKTISTDTNYLNLSWYTQQGYTSLCRNALVQFGDQAAQQKAQAKGTDRIDEGLYGFATWWGLEGKSVLSTIAGGQIHLDEVAYYDDPITYLSSLGSYDLLDSALNQVAYVDVIALNHELIGGTATWVWDVPLLKQEVSLANHHIYGSSRLGVINYWPGQYRNAWDFKTGLADTTRLNVPTPWYSYTYNDIIDSNHTEPSGGGTAYMGGTYYGLTHSSISQHLLGQKQYELTNHLGNVQATLSDKRYVKTTGGGTVRDYFNASIVAAYDYYPYGMLMPDRFVSDTATRCVTTTQTQMVPVKTTTSVLSTATAVTYPGSTTFGGTTISFGSGGEATIYGQTGGMQIDIPVTAGIPIDIGINVSYIYGSFISLSLSENIGLGTYKPLANTNANYPGTVTLSATPSTTTMRLNITMMSSYITAPLGGLFTISSAGSEKITYTPQNVLVTLCNKGADKYEFGFNTQMKSNEVAGIGNWNTAQFWEFNTRTGLRENKDPVFVPWESSYSVNHSNPIANSDPNGDYSKGAAFALSLLHGAHGITQDSKTGEWGYRYSLSRNPGADGVDYGPPQKKQDGNRAATTNNKPSVAGVKATQGGQQSNGENIWPHLIGPGVGLLTWPIIPKRFITQNANGSSTLLSKVLAKTNIPTSIVGKPRLYTHTFNGIPRYTTNLGRWAGRWGSTILGKASLYYTLYDITYNGSEFLANQTINALPYSDEAKKDQNSGRMAEAGVCFRSGTLVSCNGELKSIENICIGDSVYSYNLETSKIELSSIRKIFKRVATEIYELKIGNEVIWVTGEHPLYRLGRGWVKVRELSVGDELKTESGSIPVSSYKIHNGEIVVYNIEVSNNHNYFITNKKILVHNKYLEESLKEEYKCDSKKSNNKKKVKWKTILRKNS